MRFLLIAFLSALLIACTHLEREGNLGSRVVPAACVAAAAPWILGETNVPIDAGEASPALRAVTYNIHSGFGAGRGFWRSRSVIEHHLNGIAAAIATSGAVPPDVVALNEVDFSSRRSGNFDQARFIADAVERISGQRYDVIYGETWSRRLTGFEVRFGNAALVRHPVRSQTACLYDDTEGCGIPVAGENMPLLRAKGFVNRLTREARGLIKFSIDFHGQPVDVIVTHLDAFVLAEREAQAAHLLRRFVDPQRTTIVMGDINAVPTMMTHTRAFFTADRTHDILTSGGLADARVLHDSQHQRSDFRAWATYPADAPVWPLDAVIGSLDLVPREVRVLDARYSDHRGLYVQYQLTRNPTVVATQRVRHDAIRRRQLAQLLDCDLIGPTRLAKMSWLKEATLFFDLDAPSAAKATAQLSSPL